MVGASYLTAAVFLCLSVAGCGSAADDTPGSQSHETHLELTVWPNGEGNGPPLTTTLTCGGTEPAAGCAVIAAKGASLFEPTPGDVACTELYGGPQEARVTGTVDGRAVDARFSRKDGCEIARWDAIASVVPVPDWNP